MGAGQSGCKANYYKENDDDDDDDCIPIPVPCDVKKYRLTKGGTCRPIPVKGCPVNNYRSSKTGSCKVVPKSCPPNKYKKTLTGNCIDIPTPCAPNKYRKTKSGGCIDVPKLSPVCDVGQYLRNGNCVDLPSNCKQGQYKNSSDECVPIPKLPKIKAIDLESNLKGRQIINSLNNVVGCPYNNTFETNQPMGGSWCGGNYNYILPAGILPKCRGGKAQRVCYEPGTSDSGKNYYLAIMGVDDNGSCAASRWDPINSSDKTGLIDDECAKVIDLLDIDETKLPKKIHINGLHASCTADGDCRSDVCDKGNNYTTIKNKYRNLASSFRGLCIKGTKDNDDPCSVDEECLSGKCVARQCVQGDTIKGGKCSHNNECRSKNCDNTGAKPTNKCVQGDTGIGVVCSHNVQCSSGKCDSKTNRCVKGNTDIGKKCSHNDECHSGNCDNTGENSTNKCVKGDTIKGADCSHNDECTSLRCVGNTCVKGNKAISSSCTDNEECASSNCNSSTNKCVAATVNATGFSNYSGNLDTYDKTKPIDTLILVFVILMILFLLFRICKRLKVMK